MALPLLNRLDPELLTLAVDLSESDGGYPSEQEESASDLEDFINDEMDSNGDPVELDTPNLSDNELENPSSGEEEGEAVRTTLKRQNASAPRTPSKRPKVSTPQAPRKTSAKKHATPATVEETANRFALTKAMIVQLMVEPPEFEEEVKLTELQQLLKQEVDIMNERAESVRVDAERCKCGLFARYNLVLKEGKHLNKIFMGCPKPPNDPSRCKLFKIYKPRSLAKISEAQRAAMK